MPVNVDQWGNPDLLQRNRASPIASAQIRRTAMQSMAAAFISREYVDGTWRLMPEAFERYATLADCFSDHARLITQGAPYAGAWGQFKIDQDVDRLVRTVCPIYGSDPDYTAKILSEMHGAT